MVGLRLQVIASAPAQAATLLWRIIVPAMSSTLVTLVLLLTLTGQVSAAGDSDDSGYAFRGCKYDPDTIEPISYRFFSVGSIYETAFKEGEKAWDQTTVPGYFHEHSRSVDPEINVIDSRSSGQWDAMMTGQCPTDTGLYEGNEVEIEFNTRKMAPLTAKQKKIVAMHELGHAYGLAHVPDGCRLMRQGAYKFTCGTMPSADDIAGVTALYP